MAVHWEVDASEWIDQMDDVIRKLLDVTDRVVDVSLSAIQTSAQDMLTDYTHPRGTPTTSPRGGPPALVSGNLRRSIKTRRDYSGDVGVYAGLVGPTIVYGRIQELGGVIHPTKGVFLWWKSQDGWHRATEVTIPARPYMWFAVEGNRAAIMNNFVRSWNATLANAGT